MTTCDETGRCLATCTALGEVRQYDIRAQIRHISNTQVTQKEMMLTHILTSPLDYNYLYTITQEGHPIKLDRRKECGVVRKMTGSKGSIRDAKMFAQNGHEFLITGGCDRYLRVYDATQDLR